MKFDNICTKGKCEVCGKETDIVVVASQLGPISDSICKDCLAIGLEPLPNIVAILAANCIFNEDDFTKWDMKQLRNFIDAQVINNPAITWEDIWPKVAELAEVIYNATTR